MDEEALAEAVRCYPVLYDKSMKEFKDKNMKQNAWKKVAESVAGITSGRRSTMSSPKRLMFIVIAKYPVWNSIMKLSEGNFILWLELVRSTNCVSFNQNSNGIIYSSFS